VYTLLAGLFLSSVITKKNDEIDLFPLYGPHKDLLPVSDTVTNKGRDLSTREQEQIQSPKFCVVFEYKMVDRVQKGNNAKIPGKTQYVFSTCGQGDVRLNDAERVVRLLYLRCSR